MAVVCWCLVEGDIDIISQMEQGSPAKSRVQGIVAFHCCHTLFKYILPFRVSDNPEIICPDGIHDHICNF